MLKIDIKKIKLTDEALDKIEDYLRKNHLEYIIIEMDDHFYSSKLKKFVKKIKSHFDIFILLSTSCPRTKEIIDIYFSTGVHGLCFMHSCCPPESEMVQHSVDLFGEGLIFQFISVDDDSYIKYLIDNRVIPISDDIGVNRKINELVIKKRELKKYLRFISVLEKDRVKFGFAYQFQKKMILEYKNFRQNLIVGSIDESFDSSRL